MLEQNGVAERTNWKLLEVARSMTILVAIPQFLWMESINTTTFLINHSPTIVNPQVTPFQCLFSKVPDLSLLHVFRSKVYIWIEKNQHEKLDAKAKLGLFVGYDDYTKGFQVWISNNRKLIISQNVRFNKSSILNKTLERASPTTITTNSHPTPNQPISK